MRRILVAVDGSEPSHHAARFAAELARSVGARLTLAHVQVPLVYPTDPMGMTVPDLDRATGEQASQVLRDEGERVRGIVPEVELLHLHGSPADSIADAASNTPDVDLVVVGNRGRNALTRVLVGSVADRLVHICPKPVLVVR